MKATKIILVEFGLADNEYHKILDWLVAHSIRYQKTDRGRFEAHFLDENHFNKFMIELDLIETE